MGRKVAVVGAGMTKFVRRAQETGKELSWQAAEAACQETPCRSRARRTNFVIPAPTAATFLPIPTPRPR